MNTQIKIGTIEKWESGYYILVNANTCEPIDGARLKCVVLDMAKRWGYTILSAKEIKSYQTTEKNVNFYKAVSGYWIAEFPIKGERKMRRMACGNTDEELQKAILRYAKKGYKVNVK